MRQGKKIYIAEMLQDRGLISAEEAETALLEQKKTDKKLGQIIVEMGLISKESLHTMLAEQLNIQYINLKDYPLDPSIIKLLPEMYVRNLRVMLLKKTAHGYLLGMVDPQDILAQEEIKKLLNTELDVALIGEEEFLAVIDNIYRRTEEISRHAESLSAELKPSDTQIFMDENLAAQDLPVVNLLRSIFEDAVQTNASDIHIEPGKNYLRIRFRVDGVLQEQIVQEKDVTEALIQRIKLGAGMNIAEKRLPQDGRFTVTVKKMLFDVRISTMPVQYGESLVMRLLNQSSALLNLTEINMPIDILEQYRRLLTASYGLLLVVGPTGSGKTTTLYASLNELNQIENKIITVEDPVEYRFPAINQVNVNPKIGLTFANVLRTILRQDPDIIMVGELRDYETVEIALRAAMTGHFVLSTLHTHDTISSVMRLIDMGAAGYLIASVIRAVVAQRLVRRICVKCIEEHTLTDAEHAWLSGMMSDVAEASHFKKGLGCSYCHFTGYKGRIGIFELLPMSLPLIEALRDNNLNDFSRIAQQQPLYQPLVKTGIVFAQQGLTTIEEIISMAGEIG